MALSGTHPFMLKKASAAPADDAVTKSCYLQRDDLQSNWGGDGYDFLERESTGADSNKKLTISLWVKSSWHQDSSDWQHAGSILSIGNKGAGGSQDNFGLMIEQDHQLRIRDITANGSTYWDATSSMAFRDPAAWYHLVVSLNGTPSTSTDRHKVWMNGEDITSNFTVTTANYSSSFTPAYMNTSGGGDTSRDGIGTEFSGSSGTGYYPWSGYVADVVRVDGLAWADFTDSRPDKAFAEEDPTTGQWKPKEYTGSYGTHGYHLKFLETGTGTGSTTTIGADSSGNTNHYNTNQVAAQNITSDNPSAGMNYATLNPLQVGVGTNGDAPEDGNLKVTSGSSPRKAYSSTIGANSGKFYAEVYIAGDQYPMVSVSDVNKWVANSSSGQIKGDGSVAYDIKAAGGTGDYFVNSASGEGSLGITPAAGDIIMIAFDASTRKVWYGRNGSWNGTGDPSAGTNEVGTVSGTDDLVVVVRAESTDMHCNFGQERSFGNNKTSGADTSQSEFYYAPPTDFKSLSTGNLATPTIAKPSEHFSTTLYSGNSGTQSITTGLEPDLLWIKNRANTGGMYHQLFDDVRGLSAGALVSNNTDTEDSETRIASLDSTGFTTSSTDYSYTNSTGNTYVAWNWKKSATAGFNIVGWTGDDEDMMGESQTITHGLNPLTPEMIIAKGRTDNNATGSDWLVYHKDLSSGEYLILNDNGSAVSPMSAVIDNIGATTVDFGSDNSSYYFNFGGDEYMPTDPDTYVAYFFASVEGYSKVGKYVGSGVSGNFIYLGFRPRFLIYKHNASGHSWGMMDDARDPYNAIDEELAADQSWAEFTSTDVDFLSNGFRIHGTGGHINQSGEDYLFYAVAESPLKTANAR